MKHGSCGILQAPNYMAKCNSFKLRGREEAENGWLASRSSRICTWKWHSEYQPPCSAYSRPERLRREIVLGKCTVSWFIIVWLGGLTE